MDGVNFEDLCLDPYKDSLEEGRAEGRIAGLQAGFKDGRSLGRIKGLEIGTELGYMRGVAVAVTDHLVPLIDAQSTDTESLRRVEKVRKVLAELISAIDDFPSPDEMFNETDKTSVQREMDEEKGRTEGAITEKGNDTQSTGRPLDVAGKLQRVRAKFKLLIVQLKLPQLSLRKVMDEALKSTELDTSGKKSSTGGNITSSAEGDANVGQDTDW